MIRALVDPATTERVIVIPSRPSLRILHLSSLCLLFFRDYYAALLRTHQSFIVPSADAGNAAQLCAARSSQCRRARLATGSVQHAD
jgi:hypothetical protein